MKYLLALVVAGGLFGGVTLFRFLGPGGVPEPAGMTALGERAPRAPASPSSVSVRSTVQGIIPGVPFDVVITIRLEDGWHTYSDNPGDSGMSPEIVLDLGDGLTAEPVRFPKAKPFRDVGGTAYGYSGEVDLPFTVTPDTSLVPGSRVMVAGRMDWLICRDICVPKSDSFKLVLPVAPPVELPGDAAEETAADDGGTPP